MTAQPPWLGLDAPEHLEEPDDAPVSRLGWGAAIGLAIALWAVAAAVALALW